MLEVQIVILATLIAIVQLRMLDVPVHLFLACLVLFVAFVHTIPAIPIPSRATGGGVSSDHRGDEYFHLECLFGFF